MKNLPSTLTFEQTPLRIIDRIGRPWLTGADIARALGYDKTRSISNLYSRYADEFSPDMTEVLKLRTLSSEQDPDVTRLMTSSNSGNLQSSVRIFSPRGCHLVAMLARTPRAKAFRRWVLDVLENLEPVEQPVVRGRPPGSRNKTRLPLKALPQPTPSVRELLALRDRFLLNTYWRGMDSLVRAVHDYPGHTSAELSLILSMPPHVNARMVVAACQDGLIGKGEPRNCAITGRITITWIGAPGLAALPPPPVPHLDRWWLRENPTGKRNAWEDAVPVGR